MSGIADNAYVLKYKLAVARARTMADPLKLAHKVRHLGDAYYYAGRGAEAEPCYVEALSIYRHHEHTPPLDLANAIRSFAVLKDYVGADDEAKPLWQEAHELYLAVNVSAGVAESAARLALLARRQGEAQRSLEWLAEASAAADASNDTETLEYIRKVKAQIKE